MRESLSAYPMLVRTSLLEALTYRGRIVLWLLTSFFPLVLMAVWLTVVAGSGPPRGWTAGQFLSYYVAATLVWHLSGQHVVWEWDADQRSGDLSVRLLRPVHPFLQYAASDAGVRTVTLAMLLPVFVAVALLVPGVDYDATPLRLAGVVAAVSLAYVLSLLMASTFALLGFWTTQATNTWMLWWGVGSFTSGWVAPLPLMPDWLRPIAVVLPFRTTIGFPIELLTGRLDGPDAALGFAVGAGWVAAFGVLFLGLWPRAVRRYQAVAG